MRRLVGGTPDARTRCTAGRKTPRDAGVGRHRLCGQGAGRVHRSVRIRLAVASAGALVLVVDPGRRLPRDAASGVDGGLAHVRPVDRLCPPGPATRSFRQQCREHVVLRDRPRSRGQPRLHTGRIRRRRGGMPWAGRRPSQQGFRAPPAASRRRYSALCSFRSCFRKCTNAIPCWPISPRSSSPSRYGDPAPSPSRSSFKSLRLPRPARTSSAVPRGCWSEAPPPPLPLAPSQR